MSLILLGAVLATAGLSRASTPFIASGEIRPGMTGYGLTVFQGTRVTRFPVTVLGVVRGYLAGADLILIRVDGGYPVEHGTGIIAGMSGSPVYIGGRLAGAISYGYIFSKEPIGGVTPIQDMLREIAPPAGERPAGLPWGSVGRLERPVEASGQSYRQVRLAPLPEKGEPGTLVLTPLSPLIQTGGLGARALEVLKERLAPLPVRAVAGFSGPPVRASVPPLVPGAALGVQLMEGDLTASATGTLTWRDGDRLVAFGHPMGEYGDVDFPLVACYVHAIVPSYQFSYKLASPLAIVGRITRDRLWAVGGRLHQPSVMLPLRLQVGEKTYRVKVAQHRWMTAALVESCLTQAIGAAVPALSEGSARLRYRLEPAGHPPIELTDIVSGPQVDSQAAARLGELVAELMDNPFQPLKLARLEVQVETLAGQRSATVEKIYTDRSQYQPGDVVRLGVVLRPYGQAPQVRECELPLPPDLPRGTVKIGVAGGSDLELLNKTLSLSSSSPRDLDSLLRQLTSRERGQELAIRAVFPGEGLRVRQERFPQLPASLAQVLADSPHSELEKDKEVYSARLDTPWALQGQAAVQVEIVDRLAGGAPSSGSLAP
ncbi:MAG TPA: SpoIVB peptidase S55 domain-containing protein, partial [Candidatus Nitrosotenuis sp.]|nr:SpoIVB peptidase S55 domain-containing protein [Candidatus Nitrosotenuis sp.]